MQSAVKLGLSFKRPGLSPGQIASLGFWYDPSIGDVNRNVVPNGISFIEDSGPGRHRASQSTDAKRPTLTTLPNGRDAMGFVGANSDALSLATSANSVGRLVPGISLAVVFRSASLAAQQRIVSINFNTGAFAGFNLSMTTSGFLLANSRRVAADGNSANTGTVAQYTAGNVSFLFASMNASDAKITVQVDGVSEDMTATWATGANTHDVSATVVPFIGQNNSAGDILSADIGEIAMWRRALTLPERELLRVYWRHKWGTVWP